MRCCFCSRRCRCLRRLGRSAEVRIHPKLSKQQLHLMLYQIQEQCKHCHSTYTLQSWGLQRAGEPGLSLDTTSRRAGSSKWVLAWPLRAAGSHHALPDPAPLHSIAIYAADGPPHIILPLTLLIRLGWPLAHTAPSLPLPPSIPLQVDGGYGAAPHNFATHTTHSSWMAIGSHRAPIALLLSIAGLCGRWARAEKPTQNS